MSSTIPVLSTYSCHSLERLLMLKNPQNPKENVYAFSFYLAKRKFFISKLFYTSFEANDLEKFMPYLLTNVLNLLQPVTNENEYAMKGFSASLNTIDFFSIHYVLSSIIKKALMRLCLTLQDHIEPYLDLTINKLAALLNSVIKVK